MNEIEKRQVAASIGGIAGLSLGGFTVSFMAATLLNPTPTPMPESQVKSVSVIYSATANTFGVYADIFDPRQLSPAAEARSITAFYLGLLANQQRLGAEFEQV